MKARHEFSSDDDYQKYLRTYFAAMAMQGLIVAYPPKLNISENEWSNVDIIGYLSTKLADELLKRLE